MRLDAADPDAQCDWRSAVSGDARRPYRRARSTTRTPRSSRFVVLTHIAPRIAPLRAPLDDPSSPVARYCPHGRSSLSRMRILRRYRETQARALCCGIFGCVLFVIYEGGDGIDDVYDVPYEREEN